MSDLATIGVRATVAIRENRTRGTNLKMFSTKQGVSTIFTLLYDRIVYVDK